MTKAARSALPVNAVIFDGEGTLWNSLPVIKASFDSIRRVSGLRSLNDDEVARACMLPTFGAFFASLSGREYEGDSDKSMYDSLMMSHSGFVQIHDGVLQLLQELRDRGIKTGLFTGGIRAGAKAMIEVGHLDDYVLAEEMVTQGDITRMKPDPEGLLLAARKLDVTPDNAVYVGDMEYDRECARNANVPFFQAKWDRTFSSVARPFVHPVAFAHPLEILDVVVGIDHKLGTGELGY